MDWQSLIALPVCMHTHYTSNSAVLMRLKKWNWSLECFSEHVPGICCVAVLQIGRLLATIWRLLQMNQKTSCKEHWFCTHLSFLKQCSFTYKSSGVAFVAEMWCINGSGFNNACHFFFDRWAQTGGQRMWQWQLQGRSTDLISLESLSLVLQACLLSPLHLLLLFLVSLQIEFLVPGLVLEAYSISCKPRKCFSRNLGMDTVPLVLSKIHSCIIMNTETWKSLWWLFPSNWTWPYQGVSLP